MSSEPAHQVAGYDLGETIPVRETAGDRPDYETVDAAVETVADAEGELCIVLRNVGAAPWLRPTPYENHRGVTVRMWSCISTYPKAMPGRTMLFGHRVPVWPDEYDDYNVRMFTTEWVRAELRKGTHFEVRPAAESPFCTDWYDWNWDNRDRPGDGGDPLEISERQRERFESVREEWTDDHLPAPTDDQVLKGLLDTKEAAANGYYDDGENE